MSNIDKQALRSTSDRDWFEDWFKREFHPDKTGPYIKDQLFFAVRAARAPLLDELEAKDKSISFLKDQLAQLANFNPDWDKLEAATDSLREHMAELTAAGKRITELEAREVKLPELKMLSDYLAEVTMREREDILVGVRLEFFRALKEAGVNVSAAGKGEAS
ncbi:hypothetical protein [Enterobacter hormaechei]|uniref:hypothetical protein n=1 Tax=Enterobacter hormaechei TaxID=158836 RepID=UPI003D6FAC03